MYGQEILLLRDVHAKDSLSGQMEHTGTTVGMERWPHLSCLSLPQACTDQVELNIYQSNFDALPHLSTIFGGCGEP